MLIIENIHKNLKTAKLSTSQPNDSIRLLDAPRIKRLFAVRISYRSYCMAIKQLRPGPPPRIHRPTPNLSKLILRRPARRRKNQMNSLGRRRLGGLVFATKELNA
jgi:hypothetical protein